MDDTDTQVRSVKSVRTMIRDAFETGKASELADFVAGGGVIPSESLVELLRSARIVKPGGGQKGPQLPSDPTLKKIKLARLCAAYIVSSCVMKYREWSNKQIGPSEDVLKTLSDKAQKIACDHFKIESGRRHEVGHVIDSNGAKQFLYQKGAHSEVAELVHAEMQGDLMNVLDWMVGECFPGRSPAGDPL